MTYRLICIGRRAQDPLLQAAQDYLDRLNHYVKSSLQRLREGTFSSEGQEILRHLPAGSHVVILDERGTQLSTSDWVGMVQNFQHRALRDVVFVIGGADGLHPDVKKRAQQQVSLGRATMPHRLAQVVLLEQLYRAHTVLRGERYHRA